MAATTHPDQIGQYDLFDIVRISATVVASGGAITQPSSMVVGILPGGPSGILPTYYAFGSAGASIANPSPGVFYKDVVADVAGQWRYSFHPSGIVGAREEWSFIVDPTVFTL